MSFKWLVVTKIVAQAVENNKNSNVINITHHDQIQKQEF